LWHPPTRNSELPTHHFVDCCKGYYYEQVPVSNQMSCNYVKVQAKQ
jgi:hypothetical protein